MEAAKEDMVVELVVPALIVTMDVRVLMALSLRLLSRFICLSEGAGTLWP